METTVSRFNYVLMSPVYDSISKQGYRSGYSKDELKQAQESGVIHEKVVALGGISEVNLAEIKSLGFGGAALLGFRNRYLILSVPKATTFSWMTPLSCACFNSSFEYPERYPCLEMLS